MDSQWLFAQPCTFVIGVEHLHQLPPLTVPEVAFIGRSNVGKSSLINALTGRSTLARTSNTPGRTQQLNFFLLSDVVHLIDLPGYGYAEVPIEKVKRWTAMMKTFLQGRTSLNRVYVLVDSRHGLKSSDHEMMTLLDQAAVSYQVILTKCDKIKNSEAVKQATEQGLKTHPAAFPVVHVTSSETREGIPELRQLIIEAIT